MGSALHSEFGMPKGHLKWGNSTRDGEPRLKASLWNRNKGMDFVRMGWGKESRMRGGGLAPCEDHGGASRDVARAATRNPKGAITAAREVSEEGGVSSMISTDQVKGRED